MSDIRKHDMAEGYDFGDDADIPLPGDPAFDAWVGKLAPDLNTPPVTPRMEMWDAIQKAQAAPMATSAPVVSITSRRRAAWVWPTAIAAALLIGVGIDRYMLTSRSPEQGAAGPSNTATGSTAAIGSTTANGSSTAPGSAASSGSTVSTGRPSTPGAIATPSAIATTRPTSPVGAPNAAYADSAPTRLYRLAAVQTLTQAEAVLTAYRSTDLATRNPAAAKQLSQWGREVLSSTRLLLDSPAGDDPQLRALLDDVELVLVQIIRLSGSTLDATERALIDGAMRDHDLLPRIRTAVPAGSTGATD